jgi:cystathionine gamma-synthase
MPLSDLQPATRAIHADALSGAIPRGEADVAPPLHVSTTFSRPSMAAPPPGLLLGAGTDNKKGKHKASKKEKKRDKALGDMYAVQQQQQSQQSAQGQKFAPDFVYGRADQPTRHRVESVIASLEGGEGVCAGSVCFSSGMAAMGAVLNRVLPKRIALDAGYAATADAVDAYRRIIGQFGGAAPQVISLEDLRAELEADRDSAKAAGSTKKKAEKTRKAESDGSESDSDTDSGDESDAGPVGVDLILIETPRNPDTRLIDVAEVVELARRCRPRQASVAVDSTFASPISFRPLEHGADFAIHSATKILGGHSDLMGGVVSAREPANYARLHSERTTLGNAMGAMECWLLLRSLRTLPLRVERAGETCLEVAKWLQDRVGADFSEDTATAKAESGSSKSAKKDKRSRKSGKKEPAASGGQAVVSSVSHCFLRGHPDRDMAKRLLSVPPYCLSFELKSVIHAEHLAEFTHLFANATSLGGCESLLDWRKRYDADISPHLVRMSVGLEDARDLIADLEQALTAVAEAWPVE